MGVDSGHHEEYWNDCPGESSGCSPTTPGPCTSRVISAASVIIQCRLIRRTVSEPWLVIRTVYWNTHSLCCGLELAGGYWGSTSTRVFLVEASGIGGHSRL